MFKKLAEQLKANARTIVFTEGTDARILEPADKLTKQKEPHKECSKRSWF